MYSITRAEFSIWFFILLIFFASVCTTTNVDFYVLYIMSSVLPHIPCPVPLGILFSLQTQHRIKNVSFSPYRTKIQEPLYLWPLPPYNRYFYCCGSSWSHIWLSLTPLNCSSFNVEHNSWYPFSNSSSGLCVFAYLHCSHCFVLVKAKAKVSIKVNVGQNDIKHKTFAYYCPSSACT